MTKKHRRENEIYQQPIVSFTYPWWSPVAAVRLSEHWERPENRGTKGRMLLVCSMSFGDQFTGFRRSQLDGLIFEDGNDVFAVGRQLNRPDWFLVDLYWLFVEQRSFVFIVFDLNPKRKGASLESVRFALWTNQCRWPQIALAKKRFG